MDEIKMIKELQKLGYSVVKKNQKVEPYIVRDFGRHNFCTTLNVWQFTTNKGIPKEKFLVIQNVIEKHLNKK